MVKWYNESLPRISGGFDSPWPHIIEKARLLPGFFYYVLGNRKTDRAKRGSQGRERYIFRSVANKNKRLLTDSPWPHTRVNQKTALERAFFDLESKLLCFH